MRALLIIAGAGLALSACSGGNNDAANETDTLAVNNLIVDDGSANMMMNGDMNAMTGGDMNAVDSDTQNAMKADLNTNDPDTNLANGI